MNETTQTKTADQELIEAMSRVGIFNLQFVKFLYRRGVMPENIADLNDDQKRELAVAINNTLFFC